MVRSLSFRSAWLVATAGLLLWACGGADRSFVPYDQAGGSAGAAGSAGQGQGGSSTGGTTGDAGAADGGTGGGAGAADGGTGGGGSGNGGTAGGGAGGTAGGGGGTGGSAGNGGTGGIVVPPDPGRPGYGIVGSGNWMKSPNYKLFGQIGESPGANRTWTSPSYRLTGSVIGTSQP